MLLHRQLSGKITEALLQSGKIILLYGPRQAGKTTLSKEVIMSTGLKTLSINADQLKYIDILSSRDLSKLQSLVSGYELLFIDEGQRVPEIGINLKILHDEIPHLKILVTGSSSFLLSDRVTEALTGRKMIFTLLPVSVAELRQSFNPFEMNDQLDDRLIYGCYPEVITTMNASAREELLNDISTSYIFKDILEMENIRYPLKIREILKLLAHQAGSEVSINELCRTTGLNRETVERYLHLMEQSFIIFRLAAYSRNPRNEINKSQKFYFYDNGIRNSIIDNLKPVHNRTDTGVLWENFMISEMIKKQHNTRQLANHYFWRTYSGSEIDLVREVQGQLIPYEIKLNKVRKTAPKAWTDNYGSEFYCITRDNYLDFV
jgi:predicted AAA+ superfamily ATPase